MGFLNVEGDRRIYFEHYAGAKTPVVLIHGWGTSLRAWDGILAHLQALGHAVVSFDQRGCAKSDKDFRESSIAASAGDVVALLDHLGLSRAVLNGWSLGGAVAVEAAHRLGPRCAGVVSTCGATPRYVQGPDFPHGAPAGTVAGMVETLRADRASFLLGLSQGVCAKPVGDAVVNWMWAQFMEAAPSADEALRDLDVIDQRGILAALDVPFLSIVGSLDAVAAPEIGRAAAALAPRGRLEDFEDCGHAPFVEDRDRYNRVLAEFLATCG